ncbi:hypothetical protein DUNSADRAFT_3084 [Dunaliella salina]|uniref:RWP-RK domain-containing protein n=1 Tax=Dunaliella salina TaxID=3046 RepID=A0ABQ7GUM7_DUNSA|nr:hypothetical protein DUNSADRAFT_3084 [Dunaliella salina]|eukprot:KAF5838288.1 hypothetical protein DUNSADRAFT_3084 [Dunaliella salina]
MSTANQLRQSIDAALFSYPLMTSAPETGSGPPDVAAAGVHNSTCVQLTPSQFSSAAVKQEEEEEGGAMRPQQGACVKHEAIVKQEQEEVKQDEGEAAVMDRVPMRMGGTQARRPGLDVANHNNLCIDDLRPHFFKSREDAALCLRVSINSLKAACRRNGVDRWPYRKLLSLVNLTEAMKGKASEQEQAEMQAELAKVVANPNHEVNENTVKLKLANYKDRYRRRTKGGRERINPRCSRSKPRGGKNCGRVQKRTKRKCQPSTPSSSHSSDWDCASDPLTRNSSLTAPGWPPHDEDALAATRFFASSSPDSGSQERGVCHDLSSVDAQPTEHTHARTHFALNAGYSGVDATAYITSTSGSTDMRKKGGMAQHQHQQEQQQQQQQQQQWSRRLREQLGPARPPGPPSRMSSSQQVMERQGSGLDSCPPVLMSLAPGARAHPHHPQPLANVGAGLITAEQLHPQQDRAAPSRLRATPSARSSSTLIATDVAPPLPLQLPQPSQRLAAPLQQQQGSGSGSDRPAPLYYPPPTTQPYLSFDIGAGLGGTDYRNSSSLSPHVDCTGSAAALEYAQSTTGAAMLVGNLSEPQPPPVVGHTHVHLFNVPAAVRGTIQKQQQQQQQQEPLPRTLLHTQPAVPRVPPCEGQHQLQQRQPRAPTSQHPWADHTHRDPIDTTQAVSGAAWPHALPPLAAVSEEETAHACAETGRGDTQEMLPAPASIPTLPLSRGLASVEFHYNDANAGAHARHGDKGDVDDLGASHPRLGLLSQQLVQQPPPNVHTQQPLQKQEQPQHQQGQQLPDLGRHSLEHELHSGSNVPFLDLSMFMLQEDKEEGGQSQDCSMPSAMHASAARFTRLSDPRMASPPSVPMDTARIQSSSFPGNTHSLQNLADLASHHHHHHQQQQQQREEEGPQQLDDLLEALDGFEEPPGLSDFNSAPLPRLPSFDHDMEGYFDFVVRSGLW